MGSIKIKGATSGSIILTVPDTGADNVPVDVAGLGLPTGLISMWSGAASAIPNGWFLCDGANGTPNLVGKFIKGGSTAGATGGSTSTAGHTLTIAEMPSHQHTVYSRRDSYGSGDGMTGDDTGGSDEQVYYGKTGGMTDHQGGGSAHSHNMEPVYFQLCYIMKGDS